MARKSSKRKLAVRLPSGKYAWGGRAVPFSEIPKKEQARFRAVWGRKAAKVRQFKTATRAIVVKVSDSQGNQKNKGAQVFTTNRVAGASLRNAVLVTHAKQKRVSPEFTHGVWTATVKWPDDPRSESRKPYRTLVGTSKRELTLDRAQNFADYLIEIEGSGEKILKKTKKRGESGSGASGAAIVIQISLLAWKD